MPKSGLRFNCRAWGQLPSLPTKNNSTTGFLARTAGHFSKDGMGPNSPADSSKRVQEAGQEYQRAKAASAITIEEQASGRIPGSDGHYALLRPLRMETAAAAEYTRVLRVFQHPYSPWKDAKRAAPLRRISLNRVWITETERFQHWVCEVYNSAQFHLGMLAPEVVL